MKKLVLLLTLSGVLAWGSDKTLYLDSTSCHAYGGIATFSASWLTQPYVGCHYQNNVNYSYGWCLGQSTIHSRLTCHTDLCCNWLQVSAQPQINMDPTCDHLVLPTISEWIIVPMNDYGL